MPGFHYDRSRGQFRDYIKRVVYRTLCSQFRRVIAFESGWFVEPALDYNALREWRMQVLLAGADNDPNPSETQLHLDVCRQAFENVRRTKSPDTWDDYYQTDYLNKKPSEVAREKRAAGRHRSSQGVCNNRNTVRAALKQEAHRLLALRQAEIHQTAESV